MYFWAVVTSFYVRYTLPYRWIAFATNVYSSLITSERKRKCVYMYVYVNVFEREISKIGEE